MRKRLTASALLALTVLATMATGQPPASSSHKPDDKKAEKKPADTTDAAIAAALANDPDVKMARAKIQLAEAELAKARLAVAQKVTALRAAISLNKSAVEVAEVKFNIVQRQASNNTVSAAEVTIERLALLRAQSALATAEAELKLLTGAADGTGGGPRDSTHPLDAGTTLLQGLQKHEQLQYSLDIQLAIQALHDRNKIKGPVSDRIRAALDKPVKLGAKGQEVTFTQAMEIFKKEAGLDVPVRGTLPVQFVNDPQNPKLRERAAAIDSEGETLPVGAWLQLFQDNAVVQLNTGVVKYHFYVREYGLLISSREFAPTDAPTLTEFWKQKPATDSKSEPAPNK